MQAAFPETKASTPDPNSRVTKNGITVSAQGDYVLLTYGTSWIGVPLDVAGELANDIRVMAAGVTSNATYRPGAGMTAPAGSDPMANDASSAAPDLQGGGGNNARTTATSSGGNSAASAFGQWLRGMRPPTVTGNAPDVYQGGSV